MATTIKGLKDKDGLKCEIGKDYVVGLNDALAEKADKNNPTFTGTVVADKIYAADGAGELALWSAVNGPSVSMMLDDDNCGLTINAEYIDGSAVRTNLANATTTEKLIPTSGAVKAALDNKHVISDGETSVSVDDSGNITLNGEAIGIELSFEGGGGSEMSIDSESAGYLSDLLDGSLHSGKVDIDKTTSHNVDFDSTSEDFGVDGLDSETTFGTKIIKIGYTKRVGTPLVSYNFTDYAKLIIAKRTANTQVGSQLLIQKVIIEQEDSIKIFSRTRAFPINPQLPWDSWTLKSITLS